MGSDRLFQLTPQAGHHLSVPDGSGYAHLIGRCAGDYNRGGHHADDRQAGDLVAQRGSAVCARAGVRGFRGGWFVLWCVAGVQGGAVGSGGCAAL